VIADLYISPPRPNIRYEPSTDSWIAEEAFTVVDRKLGRMLFVTQGFTCDGASIPRFCWRLVGKHELGEEAPCAHDLLYRTGGAPPRQPRTGPKWSKQEADDLFHRIMLASGVKPWKAKVAYAAVKVFGGSSWRGAK
jgi:hypothetical protein